MSLLVWKCGYVDQDGLRCDGEQAWRRGDTLRYRVGPPCPQDRRHQRMRVDGTEVYAAIQGAARRWRP